MLLAMPLILLAAALLSFIIRHYVRRGSGWVLAAFPLTLFAYLLQQMPMIARGGALQERVPWVAALHLEFVLVLDALGLLFALLITGSGSVVVLSASQLMSNKRHSRLFFFALLACTGALLGLVLAGNLFTLITCWQLAACSGHLLVGQRHEEAATRRGAHQFVLVTMSGSLLLLAGVLLLSDAAQRAGVASIQATTFAALASVHSSLIVSNLYAPALLLILGGCLALAAQVPLHFWLPGTTQNSAPTCAYLAAAIAPTGVYLLARLAPALHGTVLWTYLVLVGGVGSFLYGAVQALRQHRLKLLLAHSSVSQLGALIMLIGWGGSFAPVAVGVLLLSYVLMILTLLLLAGIIEHTSTTDNMRRLGQLYRSMPVTGWLAVLAAGGLAGVPLLLSFQAHTLLFAALLDRSNALLDIERMAVLLLVITGLALHVAASWRLVYPVFFGPRPARVRSTLREAPAHVLLLPGMLASLLLLLTLPWPGLLDLTQALVIPAATVISGMDAAALPGLWQGSWVDILLALIALGLGTAFIVYQPQVQRVLAGLPSTVQASRFYDAALDALFRSAALLTSTLQSGQPRSYTALTLLVWLGLVGSLLIASGLQAVDIPPISTFFSDVPTYEALAALLILAGVPLIVETRSRLEALLGLASVGAMLALLFLLAGAPDLALIQIFLVTLSSVFLLLLFPLFPTRYTLSTPRLQRLSDTLIAGGVGLLMSVITFVVATRDQVTAVSANYLAQSVPQGKGANVITVILTDFRSFDMLGLLVVLLVAMLSIYGLLRLRRSQIPSTGTQARE